jgi:uncharacterized repeat protein (TIGR01451 family)
VCPVGVRLGFTAVMTAALVAVPLSPPANAAVAPSPNPEIPQACGIDLTLVLDASGSIESSHAVDKVRQAGSTLLDSLSNTSSTARVIQFATLSERLASRTQIDDTAMAPTGVLGQAIQGYYNPIPPRPGNVNIYRYNSGNPQSSSSFRLDNSQIQYTNWDGALHDAVTGSTGDLVVFVTDGDPTAYDLDRAGDPFDQGPPPDVAMNTNRSQANQVTLDRAVEEANAIKATGARVLTIGVGSGLSNSSSINRLTQVSGPQVVRDSDLPSIDSLNQIDVALVQNFDDLSAVMRSLVLQLCSPSLTIRKLAQGPGDATYSPTSGWPITVTPEVPGGTGFDWILPDPAPAASKTQDTDNNGFAQFQWEPIPPEEDSRATVTEGTDPDYTAGRPGADNDYRCEAKDEFGNVRVIEGDFADPDNPSFVLDPIHQEIVTCSLYNSYDYQPDIALTKVNSPTEARGDLTPPAELTSDYVVTNPGNTPLANVTVTDDRCGPVVPVPPTGTNAGDTNGDGLLDPGESWQFTCDRPLSTGLSTDPNGVNIVNTATVTGNDPSGTVVTDTSTDDVDLFTPAISLVKTVNGAKQATISSGDQVTYRYEATNEGNTPLSPVTLTDDTPPCTSPTRRADPPPGNDDNVLDVGETWVWTCQANPTADVVNTADVVGVPVNPVTDAPFTDPNPPVTDEDRAEVNVVDAAIELTKVADPTSILLDAGANPPAENVQYTFSATNTGTAILGRPGGTPATDPGWVIDPNCNGPTTYTGGDTSPANGLMDPGETWTFTCTASVDSDTLNVAVINGQPVDGSGDPLGVPNVRDLASAFVTVAHPDIEIQKTALRPVVLDPDAPAVAGPDVPTPRQAEYEYQVSNPGDVPLSLAANPPTDDRCAPVTFVDGDADGDGLLDPGEVWNYTCTTTLEREDANVPPGNESGLVENTVTVTGVPFFNGALVTDPDKQPSDSDKAQVLVIEPGIDLTKTASASVVANGTDVTYTITISNTGDVGLTVAAIDDDKCSPLVYQSGDANGNDLLDGANSGSPETWTYTCTRTISTPTPPATEDVNTATVTGIGPLGNSYEATDQAAVRVLSPAIALTKSVDHVLVPAGTDVGYDFEVTNVGTSPLAADDVLDQIRLVDVSAPALPVCDSPTLVSKEGGNQDDRLDRDPAEIWRYHCDATINEDTDNVAVVGGVGGIDVGLEIPVFDFDVAHVGVFHPAITIEKSASPTVLQGSGDVTYTYHVRNTGDVPLADVESSITDDKCSPLVYQSGDQDGDGLLDTPDSIFEDSLDETWVFTCTAHLSQTTRNTVLVTGTPTDPEGNHLCGPDAGPGLVTEPCDVEATDTAKVIVKRNISPGGGNKTPPTHPPLVNTGAPPGLLLALVLGLASVVAGGALLVADRRRWV